MKSKNSIFQWVVLGVFFFLALLGFILFANFKGAVKEEDKIIIGDVVIWGTMDKKIVDGLLNNLKDRNDKYSKVIYIEKSKNSYNQEILEALASGEAPDLMLLSNENIFKNLNKIYQIPYTSLNQRDFLNTYVDASNIFLDNSGIWAIPFAIDPMVMYYNKSIFQTAAIPLPPKHWREFFDLAKKITVVNDREQIEKSAIAFGESINVRNLKGILSTLMMQMGNKIIFKTSEEYVVDNFDKDLPVTQGILFFTEFSNQASQVYSWNRSMPDSLDYFLSGRLATYFGFSSEAPIIRFKNPNLNFDVAEIPSIEKIDNKSVYAKIWGMAIPKSANINRTGAFYTALALSDESSQKYLSEKLLLPPVRKSLLSQRPEDSFMDIFYREAIYAKSFIDPSWKETNKIFSFMIDSITGGRFSPKESVGNAFNELELLLK